MDGNYTGQLLIYIQYLMSEQTSLVLQKVKVYSIQDKRSTQIAASNRWLLQQRGDKMCLHDGDDFTVYFGKQLLKIKYKQTQVLFIKNENAYIAILLPNPSDQIDIIQYRLQMGDVKVTDWQKATNKAQEDIKNVSGKNIGEQFSFKSASKGLTYKIGGFFGAINNLVSKPSAQVNKKAAEKVEQLKQDKLSQETKSKWQNFKEKAKELNHGAAEAIKPAKQKLGGIADKIGDKFQKSENSLIKGIRTFGRNFRDSLNQGYRNSMGGSQRPQMKQEIDNKQFKGPQSNRHLT